MSKIRVLIVDDSVVIRRLLADCLQGEADLEVVGTAANGQIGLAKIAQLSPDLVTLDIEMPVMDGLQTLPQLRKIYPRLPVIMFSTLTERGAVATLEALALGATDYVTKPANIGSVSAAFQRVREELIPKIRALGARAGASGATRPTSLPSAVSGSPVSAAFARTSSPVLASPSALGTTRSTGGNAEVGVVAIGVSTGGPNALAALLPVLANPFPVPIVIVQHMPVLFTRLLAERLSAVSALRVREGEEGALLRPGDAWIAPGGFHMDLVKSDGGVRLHLHEGPHENSCRPAVDVLFRSVAQIYGARTLGIILTGMGQDGLRGCERIRESGGQVLVQDEATSVVWGMPGAVSQAGLAHRVLPLAQLAPEINRRARADSLRPALASLS